MADFKPSLSSTIVLTSKNSFSIQFNIGTFTCREIGYKRTGLVNSKFHAYFCLARRNITIVTTFML